MDCVEFAKIVHDLSREDSVGNGDFNDALLHADSCASCDALLREAEQLTAGLRQVADSRKFVAAPERVERALLASLREKRAPLPRRASINHWLTVSVAGVAAVMLFAFLLVRSQIATPSSAPVPQSPRESTAPQQPAVQWAADSYPDFGEATESFLPLSDTFDESQIEDTSIVRVSLSDRALESMGVTWTGSQIGSASRGMLADILVSHDGTPEAIRLVDSRQ